MPIATVNETLLYYEIHGEVNRQFAWGVGELIVTKKVAAWPAG